jgi:hypothetical protein
VIFNFKCAVKLDWLNQSSLHNWDWKNAVNPHFLHKDTSKARQLFATASLSNSSHGESVSPRRPDRLDGYWLSGLSSPIERQKPGVFLANAIHGFHFLT